MSIFSKIKQGLTKTSAKFAGRVRKILHLRKFDSDVRDELEEAMLEADMGVETTARVLDQLEEAYRDKKLDSADDAIDFLKARLIEHLTDRGNRAIYADIPPTVILVAGVNGTGKTTSIAKIAYINKLAGRKVVLAASDTFRAAAVEQLTIWADRIGVDIIKHKMGADPAAVCYDAVDAARARGADLLIVDTAGRLHTQTNLMRELEKIRRVIRKKIPEAPHEVLLVIDATTGQNGVQQARYFNELIDVTGIILSKLDGTAKGGIIVAIKEILDLPVKYVGVGETPEDIAEFDAKSFVDALFD